MDAKNHEVAGVEIPNFALVDNKAAVSSWGRYAVFPDDVANYIESNYRIINEIPYRTKLMESLHRIRMRRELPVISIEQATILEAARERVRSIPVSLSTIYKGICSAVGDIEPDDDALIGFEKLAEKLRRW